MNKRLLNAAGALLASAAAVSMIAGLVYLDTVPESKLLEKISVNGWSLAGDRETALTELHREAGRFLDQEREYHLGEQLLAGTPSQTGFYVDWERFDVELNQVLRPQLGQKLRLILIGKNIPLPLEWDEKAWAQYRADHPVETPMENPHFAIKDETIEVEEGRAGRELSAEDLREETMRMWQGHDVESPITMSLVEVPMDFARQELEPLLPQAMTLKDREITLKKAWSVESVQWLWNDHLKLIIPQNGTLKIDPKLFEGAMQELAPEWETTAVPASITETETGVQFEGSARFGEHVDWIQLRTALEADIVNPKPTESIDVAVQKIAPEITVSEGLKSQGVTDLISVGVSSFYGSPPNRIHNIHVGVEKFNGTVVQPGEEFSFTANMGHVDASGGWLPELVIKGDETVPEYGGGLCQVSSTMYRAALYAGLPITRRINHSYAVSYYAQVTGYGLDATVYDPSPDMRFVNDTSAPIVVQSYVDGMTAYFVFYGQNDGRQVTLDGPYVYGHNSVSEPVITYTDKLAPGERKLESPLHVGFQTDWYRTIHYSDGRVLERENIHSNYEARPPKYLEGKPADAAPL